MFYFSTWYERTPLSFEAVPVQPLFIGQKLCCVHGVTLLKNGVMRHCGTFGTLLQQQSITHRCVAVLLLFLMILVTSADGRWPCDLCQIFVSETGEQRYYLGSLAAANHVKQHNENTDAPISMVLSFCGQEMQKIRGQPYEGWEQCFRSVNVTHHAWLMDDVKTNHAARPDVCADMAQQWFTMWIQMCEKLMLYETACAHASLPFTVLFHCFGGIHRSSAALCAWLLFRHDLSPMESLCLLLKVRPSLAPWTQRDHVFWVLHEWYRQREALRDHVRLTTCRPE